MAHICMECNHDCSCPVTEHIGNCNHHKHRWTALDQDTDGYGTPGNYYCHGCRQYQRDVQAGETRRLQLERMRAMQLAIVKERIDMGA